MIFDILTVALPQGEKRLLYIAYRTYMYNIHANVINANHVIYSQEGFSITVTSTGLDTEVGSELFPEIKLVAVRSVWSKRLIILRYTFLQKVFVTFIHIDYIYNEYIVCSNTYLVCARTPSSGCSLDGFYFSISAFITYVEYFSIWANLH